MLGNISGNISSRLRDLVIFLKCRKFFVRELGYFSQKIRIVTQFFFTSITECNFPKKAKIFQHKREMFLGFKCFSQKIGSIT